MDGSTCGGAIYVSWRNYIYGSLKSLCIRIQTLIKVLYTRFQAIYYAAALSKSSSIAISLALRVIKGTDITYLLIRSSGIRLNLLLRLFKLLLNDITLLLLK